MTNRSDTYDDEQWQLVPKEPTVNMINSTHAKYGFPGGSAKTYPRGYKAYLAAAPTPPASAQNVGLEPSAVPAGDGGKLIRFIDRAIVQEERACRVEDMLIDLVNQIRKTSPVDDHGHSTTMNAAYLKAVKYLDDADRPAPAGADALTDDEIVALAAPYCDDSGWMNGDQIFAFARAVFAKRGGA